MRNSQAGSGAFGRDCASILPQGVAAVISYCRIRPWQAYDSAVAPTPTPILSFLGKTAGCLMRAIVDRLEERIPLKRNDRLNLWCLPGDFRARARVVYCEPLGSNSFAIGLQLLASAGQWK